MNKTTFPFLGFALILCCLAGLGALVLADEPPATPTLPDQQQTDEQQRADGEVIRIGEPQTEDLTAAGQRANEQRLSTFPGDPQDLRRQRAAVSPYYIGLDAAPVDDALRSHVELPDQAGLLVEDVYPDSPAQEAGFQRFDIIVTTDGDQVSNVSDLVAVVDRHGGENPASFDVEIIRHGKAMSLSVTPAKRPAQPFVAPGRPGIRGPLSDRLERFGMRPGLGQFIPSFPAPFSLEQVPGGVSIAIERQGDAPAKITVRRGDESWVIEGDDPEALDQLPEDLRPMVEGMLQQQGVEGPLGGFPGFDIEERMRRMEQQMRQLQEMLEE